MARNGRSANTEALKMHAGNTSEMKSRGIAIQTPTNCATCKSPIINRGVETSYIAKNHRKVTSVMHFMCFNKSRQGQGQGQG